MKNLPLNHEVEVSNPFNIQTECSALTDGNSDIFERAKQCYPRAMKPQ